MPRDGSGIYVKPFPDVVEATTIDSAVYNGYVADVETDLNAPRPIVAGGTGATSAAAARAALGVETASQHVTNYDSHTFESGSFYSEAGATVAPTAGDQYFGTAIIQPAPNTAIMLQAYNATTGDLWLRGKIDGEWTIWYKQQSITPIGDGVGIAAEAGDMWYGVRGTSPSSRFAVNAESDLSGADLFVVLKSGNVGIGSASPARKLHIAATDGSDGGILVGGNYAYGSVQGSNAAGSISKDLVLNLGGSNVGIGTAAPSGKLHVAGNIISDAGILAAGTVTANALTSNSTIDASTKVIAGGSGSTFGGIAQIAAAPTRANANILLYNFSETNWSGLSADASGSICIHTGSSTTQATRIFISSAATGYVGVGMASPSAVLHVNGDVKASDLKPTTHIGLFMDGSPTSGTPITQHVAIANATAGAVYFSAIYDVGVWTGFQFNALDSLFQFRNGGYAYKPGGGAWIDTSDARIKTVVGDYEPGLAEVLALTPKRFVYKGNDTYGPPQNYSDAESGNEEIVARAPKMAPVVPYKNSPHYNAATAGREFSGLIAQDVEAAFPAMVRQNKGYIDGVEVDDMRDLDNSELVYACVNAIKELNAKIEALQ